MASDNADVVKVLRDDGEAVAETDPHLSSEDAVALYRTLVSARRLGSRLDSLAEAGAIGFAPTALGDEAALVGAAFALRDGDWVFPSHRDAVIALARGASLGALVGHAFANASSPSKGRQTPGNFGSRAHRVASPGLPTASHAVHAVGLAWAGRREGVVALATLPELAVETGEIHNALNFAGVMKAPCVFLFRSSAEADPPVAERGVAYGVPALVCDGADALAVVATVRRAVERAASGDGATIVEARSSGSASGDAFDPVVRLCRYLQRTGALSEAADAALLSQVDAELAAAVSAAERAPAATLDSLFDDVFATPPWHLALQRDEARRSQRRTY